MNAKETERLESLETLREILTPGDTVYTVLRHVSTSGMSRDIYGRIVQATFLPTKDACRALLQSGTRDLLFEAAWRRAVAAGAVSPSRRLTVDDGEQTLEHGRQEAEQVDAFISELVNSPTSKFYIHG